MLFRTIVKLGIEERKTLKNSKLVVDRNENTLSLALQIQIQIISNFIYIYIYISRKIQSNISIERTASAAVLHTYIHIYIYSKMISSNSPPYSSNSRRDIPRYKTNSVFEARIIAPWSAVSERRRQEIMASS